MTRQNLGICSFELRIDFLQLKVIWLALEALEASHIPFSFRPHDLISSARGCAPRTWSCSIKPAPQSRRGTTNQSAWSWICILISPICMVADGEAYGGEFGVNGGIIYAYRYTPGTDASSRILWRACASLRWVAVATRAWNWRSIWAPHDPNRQLAAFRSVANEICLGQGLCHYFPQPCRLARPPLPLPATPSKSDMIPHSPLSSSSCSCSVRVTTNCKVITLIMHATHSCYDDEPHLHNSPL